MIYKSRIQFFWTFTIVSLGLFYFVIGKRDLEFIVIWMFVSYLTALFTMKTFSFDETIVIRNYILSFSMLKTKIDYKSIESVEIRDIKAPYQLPYVILHFSNNHNSKWFMRRAFTFKKGENLDVLLKLLNSKGVKINYTS